VSLKEVLGDLPGDDVTVGHKQVGVATALLGGELEGKARFFQ